MGVEGIIEIIEREAEADAGRIIEDAERQASEMVADAEALVQARVEAAIERLGPEIRAASQRRINAVRLRILEGRAREDAARLVAVFDAAEERVAAIAEGADAARWSSALSRLCAEALRAVGERAQVSLRTRDVGAVQGLVDTWHAGIVALADDEPPGLIANSRDGRIEVDARLSTRLERARSLLAEDVAQLLRLEAADRQPASAE